MWTAVSPVIWPFSLSLSLTRLRKQIHAGTTVIVVIIIIGPCLPWTDQSRREARPTLGVVEAPKINRQRAAGEIRQQTPPNGQLQSSGRGRKRMAAAINGSLFQSILLLKRGLGEEENDQASDERHKLKPYALLPTCYVHWHIWWNCTEIVLISSYVVLCCCQSTKVNLPERHIHTNAYTNTWGPLVDVTI